MHLGKNWPVRAGWHRMMARAWLLAAGLVGVTTLAHAQSVCHQRTKFVTELGRKYLESPIAYGLTSTGQVIEVLASGTGSWTMIVTSTDSPVPGPTPK